MSRPRAVTRGTRAAGMVLLMVCLGPQQMPGQTVRQLSQVKKIYVEPLAGVAGSSQLRESLIKRLEKNGTFDVVSDSSQADAVMKGSGTLWVRGYSAINMRDPSSNRQPIYGGYLSIQLTSSDGEPLWSYLATPGKLGWKTVVDDMTSTVVRQLVAARETPVAANATAPRSTAAMATNLAGAGATFPQPLYESWFEMLRQLYQIKVTYSAVGSQEGMRLLAEKKVDFAGSEVAPAEDYQLTTDAKDYFRVASVLGGVVPVYNLADTREDLRFTAELLADIYLGKIKRWRDPRIAKLNQGVALPDAPITVIHRADGSGTTFAWSSFLARNSAEWKLNVGAGMSPAWPTGIGVKGNREVATTVRETANSIGYTELAYAIQAQLPYAAVQNRAGEFVRADLDSLMVAANSVRVGNGLETDSVPLESQDKRAYPITTLTWLLVPRQVEDEGKKAALAVLLRWALTSGQKACSALGYVPLPKELAERELRLVEQWK